MKQKETNKYKEAIIEAVVNSVIVNSVAWKHFHSLSLMIVTQFILLHIGDYALRNQLVKSKRRKRWNILMGIFKLTSYFLFYMGLTAVYIQMIIIGIVATRMMFHNDLDRTVKTVEELKEAYFIPTISKVFNGLKHRCYYVLTD